MTDTVTIRRELLENWLIAFQCGPTTQHKAMEEMEQALAAPVQSAVPDDYLIVPIQPTEEMRKRAQDYLAAEGMIVSDWLVHTVYTEMLAAAPSAPKADDPVKQMLLEALEKVDSEHEILGWMKTCELRRGRGSFGIAVMSDERALDWQSHQKNLERLIELRHAAIAAARQEGGKV